MTSSFNSNIYHLYCTSSTPEHSNYFGTQTFPPKKFWIFIVGWYICPSYPLSPPPRFCHSSLSYQHTSQSVHFLPHLSNLFAVLYAIKCYRAWPLSTTFYFHQSWYQSFFLPLHFHVREVWVRPHFDLCWVSCSSKGTRLHSIKTYFSLDPCILAAYTGILNFHSKLQGFSSTLRFIFYACQLKQRVVQLQKKTHPRITNTLFLKCFQRIR